MKLRLLLLLCLFQWSISCVSVQAATTPVVYYGKVLSGGKGVANVPVTDGTQIVLTDKKGRYSMTSTSDAEYIYITLPDGYDVPMKGKVPVFFQKVPAQPSKKVHFDFELTQSSTNNQKHVLVVWADPQVYFDEEMPQVREASKDVKELLATSYQGIPAYGIVCGDIIGDINKKPSYFAPMIDAIAETEIPFFYVIGNHDLDLNVRSNEHARTTYKSYYGPTYYSFNRGNVHYVVLDDIFFIAKSYLYVGYLTEQQLQWLEQDLKQVTPGSTVVVATHIPTYSREARRKEWGKESTMKVMNTLTVTVSGIFDNYVSNYAIMSADTCRDQWGSVPPVKTAFIRVTDNSDAGVHAASARILDLENVSAVSVNLDTRQRVGTMMSVLDYIVWMVTVCAGALAFIVLYNLTNININERIREIATIKVLGFYPGETSAYVFRENNTLTFLGMLVGLPLGKWLHAYVMSQIRIDTIAFDVRIAWQSVMFSMLLTAVFAAIVNVVMYFKLRRISMAESLKSIE